MNEERHSQRPRNSDLQRPQSSVQAPFKKNESAVFLFLIRLENITSCGNKPLSVFLRGDRAYHSGRELPQKALSILFSSLGPCTKQSLKIVCVQYCLKGSDTAEMPSKPLVVRVPRIPLTSGWNITWQSRAAASSRVMLASVACFVSLNLTCSRYLILAEI